ncbi:AAC(3) family N-acetyltransferase [Streptomyces sp. NPDC052036]|uniref:AAC(3) family N-acetyltransferase n=1 Tax=Streptomyces sp. NPDC052036 TaxID=3155171 RepID=UPI003433F435
MPRTTAGVPRPCRRGGWRRRCGPIPRRCAAIIRRRPSQPSAPLSRRIVSGHSPRCHLGECSPLARLYEEGSQVLLIGVGFAPCTAFHLAVYRMPEKPMQEYHCVVRVRGSGPGGATRT